MNNSGFVTTVRVYLKDRYGNTDSFTIPVNLPQMEAHKYYYGKWFRMDGLTGTRMQCYKVDTINFKK